MSIVPGVYRHFSGHLYEVLDTGHEVYGAGASEKPGKAVVVYRALFTSPLFGVNHYWVRTPENFAELVEHNGQQVRRFVYVGESVEGLV